MRLHATIPALAIIVLAAVRAPIETAPRVHPSQGDSTWRDHDRAAREARERGDWTAARYHAQRLDAILNGHPRVVLALARAAVHLGDTLGALEALERVAAMGMSYDVAQDADLRPLATINRAAAVTARLKGNVGRLGTVDTIATLSPVDFVAEGVAYDAPRRRLLVSSIRHEKVVALENGRARDFIDLRRDQAWGGLALAIDEQRQRLWVTSRLYPFSPQFPSVDSLSAVVLLYDVATGALKRRFELPRGNREPGDICIAPNGDLFVSDGRGGDIRVIREGSDSLQILVPAGVLISPQGCAVAADGQHIYVADYVLGLATVNGSTGAVSLMSKPRDVAVNGIDGLVRRGTELVGVQNGFDPDRIIAIVLDTNGDAIRSVRVLLQDTLALRDPTHLTLERDDITFVMNGGFDAYAPDGKRRPEVPQKAPQIGRLRSPALRR